MRPARFRTWREWFTESFLRGGYFSIRPLPTTQAEREQADERSARVPKDATRLNLDDSDDRHT
jgi:hypothetical protein